MKNLFGGLASGNLSQLGSILQTALGGATNTVGNASQTVSNNMGPLGDTIKNALQNSNLGSAKGLLGATAVGGILGALFAGDGTKDFAQGVLKVGGTAAAGALAWNFYQKWSQNKNTTVQNSQNMQSAPQVQQIPQNKELSPAEENTTMILLEAMVYAARADGHIDEEERKIIHKTVEMLFPGEEISAVLDSLLTAPIDPNKLAAKISNHEEALDLYRLSCVAVKIDSYMERSYLDGLANALKLSEEEKNSIENEALAIQQSMITQ